MTDRAQEKKRVNLTERIAANERAMAAIDGRIAELKERKAAEVAGQRQARSELAELNRAAEAEAARGRIAAIPADELAGMTKVELVDLCRAAGLSDKGKKGELIERLGGERG